MISRRTTKTGEWSEFKIIFPAAKEFGSRIQSHFTMAKSSHDNEPLSTMALTGNTTVLSPPALAFGGVFLSETINIHKLNQNGCDMKQTN